MRKPGLPKLTKQNMEDAPEEKWVDSIKSTVNVAVQQIEGLRSDGGSRGIKLLDSANVEMVEVDVQVPDPWVAATLINGAIPQVAPYSASYFMKHPDGTVEYKIFPDACVAGTTFVTLPIGYRPAKKLILAGTDGTGKYTSYTIDTNGNMAPVVLGGGGDLSISAVGRFLSLDATPVPLSCWPKMIRTKFPNITGVSIMDVYDAETTSPLPPGAAHQPAWEMTTQGGFPQVKLLNIAGLPYNRKSRVRLLIFGA